MGTEQLFSEEKQFALFLKKQKTIPESKLQICLDEQKRRRPEPIQLSSLLVEKGFLNTEQIAELLAQWKGGARVRTTAEISVPPAPEGSALSLEMQQEQAFEKALREQQILSEDQLTQILAEQQRERQKGRFIQLSSLLLMRRWISEEQLKNCIIQAVATTSEKVQLVAETKEPAPLKIKKEKRPKVPKEKKVAQFRPKKVKVPKEKKVRIPKEKKVAVRQKAVKVKAVRPKKATPVVKQPAVKQPAVKKTTNVASLPVAVSKTLPARTKNENFFPFVQLDFNQACTQAAQEEKFVLLYFYANWSAPAKLYEATTWCDDEVIAWGKAKTISLKIDIDQNQELVSKYQIRATPLILLLSPNHEVVHRITGFQNPNNFLAEVSSLVIPRLVPKAETEVAKTKSAILDSASTNIDGVSLEALSQLIDKKLETLLRQLASQGLGQGNGVSQGKTAAKTAKEGDEIEINEKKYTVLSESTFLSNLEKGVEMENVYVNRVLAPNKTFSKKISVKTSYLVEADFSEATFENHITFSGTSFEEKPIFAKVKFLKDANFKGCYLARGGDFKSIRCDKEFHFNGLFSSGYVTFQGGDFRGRSIFTRAKFETESNFLEARFKDYASFSDAKFGGRGTFEKMRFSKDVSFSNSTFGFTTMFKSTEFVGESNFLNVVFDGSIWFSHCKFRDNTSFKGSTFRAEGVFTAAKFEKDADFEGVAGDRFLSFNQVVPTENTAFTFSGTSINKIAISRETLEGHVKFHREENWKKAQKEYGLLKNNFNEINEYEDEDWAYLWEKRCERYQLPVSIRHPKQTLSKFIRWAILDTTCGYGTKPVNTFITAAIIIIGFALIYFGFNQIQPHFGTGEVLAGQPTEAHRLMTKEYNSLQQCIFYSFKIFTAAEIPSVEPEAHPLHPLHVVILIESFLGIFMITILVISFSRKVIR